MIYNPLPGETVLYTIPNWVIIRDNNSLNKSPFFILHYCKNGWEYSHWEYLGAVYKDLNRCWTCQTHIPDEIQTIYTLLDMECPI